MPKAARRTSGPKETTNNQSTPYPTASTRKSTSSSSNTPTTSPSSAAASSFLDITLPNSNSNSNSDSPTPSVPIYDTCDEIRAKINSFLDSKPPIPGATIKAGIEKPYTKKTFLEHIGGLNGNSLRRFLDARGERSGAENGVYYGAYCFFEKRRIFNDEPKSAARLAAEKKYPNGRPQHDPARSHAGESDSSSAKQKKNRARPPSIIVGPGERPSDFLTEEEKGRWFFACEKGGRHVH
ncbi:hypothetical protein MMC16_001810 [Acarospora aff. strigata]|nr:hypothetical protein [Acarospora aff. strigata]